MVNLGTDRILQNLRTPDSQGPVDGYGYISVGVLDLG
jgi:hypothetical protein